MAETKFTPGPWHPGCMTNVETSCACRSILCGTYAGSIAQITKANGLNIADGGNDAPPEAEAIANAHLIAAAPDLYEALQRMVHHFAMLPSDLTEPDSVIGKANTALAKARGEA